MDRLLPSRESSARTHGAAPPNLISERIRMRQVTGYLPDPNRSRPFLRRPSKPDAHGNVERASEYQAACAVARGSKGPATADAADRLHRRSDPASAFQNRIPFDIAGPRQKTGALGVPLISRELKKPSARFGKLKTFLRFKGNQSRSRSDCRHQRSSSEPSRIAPSVFSMRKRSWAEKDSVPAKELGAFSVAIGFYQIAKDHRIIQTNFKYRPL